MPNVTVNPIQSINVRVNQGNPQLIRGTSTFVGAADVQNQINQLAAQANLAYSTAEYAAATANTAVATANSSIEYAAVGYNFVTEGGTVTGPVTISQNLTVQGPQINAAGNISISGVYYGNVSIVDGGFFT